LPFYRLLTISLNIGVFDEEILQEFISSILVYGPGFISERFSPATRIFTGKGFGS
jgi:hypothetical protein